MARRALLCVFFIMASAFGSHAQAPATLTLGVVIYPQDALVWPIAQYEMPLEADLDLLPVLEDYPEERLLNPQSAWTQEVDVIVKEAATEADQINAIQQLLEQRVDGLVLMPASADEALQQAAQSALASGVPVVLVQRELPELVSPLKAYVGLEYFQLGYAIGQGAMGVTAQGDQKYPLKPTDQIVVLFSDPGDTIQQQLTQGFARATQSHLVGTLQVDPADSYALTQSLIVRYPELLSIFMVDTRLSAGVLEAVQEVAKPGDQIRTVAYGAMPEYRSLILERGFNGVVSQDSYGMLLKALVQLKSFMLNGTPLRDMYVPVELFYRFHLNYGTFARYPYESPLGIDLLWMWWFG